LPNATWEFASAMLTRAPLTRTRIDPGPRLAGPIGDLRLVGWVRGATRGLQVAFLLVPPIQWCNYNGVFGPGAASAGE